MITSKASIRARAQQAAEAVKSDPEPRPSIVYPDNQDAQAVYEEAFLEALSNAALAKLRSIMPKKKT